MFEKAYVQFKPMLLEVLGKLARQGFTVSPYDAEDLIHSFFLDRWPAIQRNYEDEKGTLKAYVYASFLRFARREIARKKRRSHQALERHQLEELMSPLDATETEEKRLDAEAISAALRHVQQDDRNILLEYLRLASERKVARNLNVTRHRVRSGLSNAMGQLAILLEAPPIPENEWRVTREVLGKGRSLFQAAKYLGISDQEAERLHKKNLRFLLNGIRKSDMANQTHIRETKSSEDDARQELRELLTEALTSDSPEDAMRELRSRVDEIWQFLSKVETKEDLDVDLEKVDPERLAKLYEELSESFAKKRNIESLGEEERKEVNPFLYATAGEEYEIGVALGTLLDRIEGAPSGDIEDWFDGVSPVSEDYAEKLLETPSMRGAPEAVCNLAKKGITALTLFYAIKSVDSLVMRAMKDGYLDEDGGIRIREKEDGYDVELADLSYKNFVTETARTCRCDKETAKRLLEWVLNAAEYVPALFANFKAQPLEGGGVTLMYLEKMPENLHERWMLSRLAEKHLLRAAV